MPEIGSKISLISKADIRYEGKLFTVDPNECTIALSHVRSFGTEDRQSQFPVPAQSQIYEYILFRGSDIKDITIVNTQQLPNDPAIVTGMAPGYPSHSLQHPVMPPQPQYGGYMAPGMGRQSLGRQGMSSELAGLPITPLDNLHPSVVQVPPIIPIVKEPNSELLAGSRSSTPSLARKSPTIDQAVQVSPHKDKKAVQPPVPRDSRPNRNDRSYQQELYQRRDFRGPPRENQRENDFRGRESDFRGRDNDFRGRENDFRGRENDFRGRENDFRGRDSDFRGRENDFRGMQRDNRQGNDRQQNDNRRDSYNAQQQQRQNQNQGMNRGGWINNPRGGRGGPNPGMRGRGRGGPGGTFNRAPGAMGQKPQNTTNVKKLPLKFDEEYDFDKANSEFEELRNKTAKLKIGEGEPEKPKVNGEDKKDDSGNETGLGEGEHEEEAEPDSVIYYDKAKSFFDNISCEAIERSKGRSQRTDWRTERKLNSETFGVASARRGGYRGRGGYYRPGMYRGHRGGYRGQNNRGHNIGQPQPRQPQAATSSAPTAK